MWGLNCCSLISVNSPSRRLLNRLSDSQRNCVMTICHSFKSAHFSVFTETAAMLDSGEHAEARLPRKEGALCNGARHLGFFGEVRAIGYISFISTVCSQLRKGFPFMRGCRSWSASARQHSHGGRAHPGLAARRNHAGLRLASSRDITRRNCLRSS